mgnify:CR=1 FL=1
MHAEQWLILHSMANLRLTHGSRFQFVSVLSDMIVLNDSILCML